MLILPAIDLLGGRAVRLRQGRREAAQVYDERPWERIASFAEAGARLVHVVDLDAAFATDRASPQPALVRILEVAAARAVAVQVGGGARDLAAIGALFELGARRVVVGTLAVRDPAALVEACARHPTGIVVAVDERAGEVAIAGWNESSGLSVDRVADRARAAGAVALLHTVVERDGMGEGPAASASAALQRRVAPLPVFASGGVGSLDHLRLLRDAGVAGVVIGTALYEGSVDLAQALALGEGSC